MVNFYKYINVSGSTIIHYYFNGQRVAMRTNASGGWVHSDLHSDHLGSTVFVTAQGGATHSSAGYYAFGRPRTGGIGLTDHKFTGQKRDGTGLMYFNARYYDPDLGQFLSPDTLVPDPGNLFDYNRYMYVRGNPMKYTDPTGHCVNSTTKNGGDAIDYDNADCRRYANTIANMWDRTDYWKNRFTSKEVFLNHVANNAGNGTDFFRTQFSLFLNDDAGKEWLQGPPCTACSKRPEQDFGDYTAINVSAGFLGGALIADDYGNVYLRSDNNFIGSPGFGVSRGDILLSNGNGTWTDIDQTGLSRKDKAALAPDVLVGASRGGSAGIAYLAAGVAYNLQGPAHVTVEAGGVNAPVSLSYSHASYTIQIYPIWRIK